MIYSQSGDKEPERGLEPISLAYRSDILFTEPLGKILGSSHYIYWQGCKWEMSG